MRRPRAGKASDYHKNKTKEDTIDIRPPPGLSLPHHPSTQEGALLKKPRTRSPGNCDRSKDKTASSQRPKYEPSNLFAIDSSHPALAAMASKAATTKGKDDIDKATQPEVATTKTTEKPPPDVPHFPPAPPKFTTAADETTRRQELMKKTTPKARKHAEHIGVKEENLKQAEQAGGTPAQKKAYIDLIIAKEKEKGLIVQDTTRDSEPSADHHTTASSSLAMHQQICRSRAVGGVGTMTGSCFDPVSICRQKK